MANEPKHKVSIALDVMGGELGVSHHVLGALYALKNKKDLHLHLYGDEKRIKRCLERFKREETYKDRLTLHHCSEVVTMEDQPGIAARKKDSSMVRTIEAVKEELCDCAVSAGNSGAMMASSLFQLKRIEGMERPAIMVKFPTISGYAVVLDVGANVDCKPSHLAQFALMGNAYAKAVEKIESPRVAVLSNGHEKHKGNELVREADQLIQSLDLNYIGFVEGNDIFQHKADVIVCDGFVGNVVLKCSEGLMASTMEFLRHQIKSSYLLSLAGLALKPVFKMIKAKSDPSEIGAAPLLGVRGNVLICHGSSNARAFETALYKAYEACKEGLSERIAEAAKSLNTMPEGTEGRRYEGCQDYWYRHEGTQVLPDKR